MASSVNVRKIPDPPQVLTDFAWTKFHELTERRKSGETWTQIAETLPKNFKQRYQHISALAEDLSTAYCRIILKKYREDEQIQQEI